MGDLALPAATDGGFVFTPMLSSVTYPNFYYIGVEGVSLLGDDSSAAAHAAQAEQLLPGDRGEGLRGGQVPAVPEDGRRREWWAGSGARELPDAERGGRVRSGGRAGRVPAEGLRPPRLAPWFVQVLFNF